MVTDARGFRVQRVYEIRIGSLRPLITEARDRRAAIRKVLKDTDSIAIVGEGVEFAQLYRVNDTGIAEYVGIIREVRA